jgi:N-acetylglucosaminyl-diphospho-decaprenol L-rhamnosyltransferase
LSSVPELAVVIVHYRAGRLLARAVEAVRIDLAGAGLAAELIVVDNGSSGEERRRLRELPVRVLEARHNPGYGAALNLGARATPARRLIFMNPDVLVRPGCVTGLMEALQGAAAAGPRFTWDTDGRLLLPPTERRSRSAELGRRAAGLGRTGERLARRCWRRHARRHWLAREPLRSFDLSGALLAVRRDALEAVGPFDEAFRLYFEENDWLERLRRAGLTAVLVPHAEAVHLYAQSVAAEPRAAAWFAASKARFDRRHYGRWFELLPSRFAGGAPLAGERAVALERPRLDLPDSAQGELWVEVSTSPLGFPAAAERLTAESPRAWRLPDRVWARLAPGTYFLRLSDGRGRELGWYSFERPAGAAFRETGEGWVVRSYREGDERQILELFATAFGQRREPVAWRWRYRDNPYGTLQISLALSPSGALGAHYASYPCRFVDATGDEPRPMLANQIVDTMTWRAARGVGRGRTSLLARVTRHHFDRFCEGRVGFNFGFNAGKIQRYYMKLVPGSRFFEAVRLRVLESEIEAPAGGTLRCERVAGLDDRWDSLFERVAPDYGLLVERDRRYLEWRYLDRPGVDYLMYAVHVGDRLVGWSVFRRLSGCLFWGDALFDRRFPEAAVCLLAEVRERYGPGGVPVEAWFPERPAWWSRLLAAIGFDARPEPQDLGLIYKPFTEADPMERFRAHLYFSKGDSDLF